LLHFIVDASNRPIRPKYNIQFCIAQMRVDPS